MRRLWRWLHTSSWWRNEPVDWTPLERAEYEERQETTAW